MSTHWSIFAFMLLICLALFLVFASCVVGFILLRRAKRNPPRGFDVTPTTKKSPS